MWYWFADVFVLISYWLLGRKRLVSGWAVNIAGGTCYAVGGVLAHTPSIWSVNAVFILLALWNLRKVLRGT
jgi:hypothetical protein